MVVGLTGGIGSGKTYVSSLFKELGVPVYISDFEAKKLMHSKPEVKKAIIKLFGEQAYIEGALNRKYIASQVFVNKEKLNQLNAIVHPAVAKHFKEWYASQNAVFVIKEVAILFETNGHKHCDAVILVTAPKTTRIERVVERDALSVQEVESRMKNQWEDEDKIPLSDYVISNINKDDTKKMVKDIYQLLCNSLPSC